METKQTTQQTIPGTLGGKVQPRKTWKAPFTLVQDMDHVLWGGNMIHLLICVVPAWNWARIWILYGPILGSRPQHANYKKTGWFPWRQKEGLTFLFCPIFIPFTTHYRYSQSTWKGQTTIESGGRNPTETLGLPCEIWLTQIPFFLQEHIQHDDENIDQFENLSQNACRRWLPAQTPNVGREVGGGGGASPRRPPEPRRFSSVNFKHMQQNLALIKDAGHVTVRRGCHDDAGGHVELSNPRLVNLAFPWQRES